MTETDNEIIQTLKYHIEAEDCVSCEAFWHYGEFLLTKKTLDLINRQKSEIESLKERLDIADEETQLAHKANMTYIIEAEKSKAKALKRLADAIRLEFYREYEEIIPSIMSDKIDELVKEFIGIDEMEGKTK